MNKEQRKTNVFKPTFDLKTHPRDKKGNVARENHYRLTIRDGVKEFERPPGSGYFYAENNELIRGPKAGKTVDVPVDSQFENDALKKQIEDLKLQLSNKAPEFVEINMTAKDVVVDDIVAPPASEVDNSEEIALMEAAGATEKAAELKAFSKFNKPNFIK